MTRATIDDLKKRKPYATIQTQQLPE